MEGDIGPYAATSARWIVGAILVVAGLAKLRHPESFKATLLAFGIVPSGLFPPIAVLLPILEFTLGLALLLGIMVRIAGVASAVLLGAFAVLISWNLVHGRRPSCGCFGATTEPIGPRTFVRNIVLVVLSLVAAQASPYLSLTQLRETHSESLPAVTTGVPLALITVGAVTAYILGEIAFRISEPG